MTDRCEQSPDTHSRRCVARRMTMLVSEYVCIAVAIVGLNLAPGMRHRGWLGWRILMLPDRRFSAAGLGLTTRNRCAQIVLFRSCR